MNKTKFFLIKTIIVTTTLILSGCGNSALHWIQDGDKLIVPGSEKVISQKLQIENIRPPTLLKPTLSFQVTQVDRISSTYYYKFKEVEKEWHYSSGHTLTIWTVGWIILAAPLWFYFLNLGGNSWGGDNEINIPPPTITGEKGGKPLNNYEVENSRMEITWSPTDKVKDGNTKTETLEKRLPFKNSKSIEKINNVEKEFSTDYFGEVKVDLIKDFNLIKAENDNPIEMIVSDIDRKFSTTLYINPSSWMIEYLRANSNDIEVVGESGNKTIVLGKLKAGDEYKLLHKGSQLWKVDYNGKEGFVPPNSGEIFWAVHDYKK